MPTAAKPITPNKIFFILSLQPVRFRWSPERFEFSRERFSPPYFGREYT